MTTKTWKLFVRNAKIGAWHFVGTWTDTVCPAWDPRWTDGKNRYRITRRAIVKAPAWW